MFEKTEVLVITRIFFLSLLHSFFVLLYIFQLYRYIPSLFNSLGSFTWAESRKSVATSSYLHFSTGDRTGVREKASKVLELIQQGLSYRKVAEALGLSKNTVMRIVRDSQAALPN
ncbi:MULTISPECIES: helix-turn-helix domain-containing protein [Cyanophyceae]|uniref:helix-turn-helix domain-containing protein n=1 Tax=Cyanophyceae TaxID=3028117 RepID=UPI0016857632|nr:helix-turn-helix domain-containing protein [Coleofasciculus sp. FACHB-125]